MDSTLWLAQAYEQCILNLSVVKKSPVASSQALLDTEVIITELLSKVNSPRSVEMETNLHIIYTWMLQEISILKQQSNDKKISHLILVLQSLLDPIQKFEKKKVLISQIKYMETSINDALRTNNKTLFMELSRELNELYFQLV